VLKVNNALSAASVKVQAANVGGQITLTATDFTTDISLTGSTAATRTALGLAAGPFNHTNAVLQYINSSSVAVNVTGVGNNITLTGELSGIKVTLGASTVPGSLLSVAPTNQSFQVGADLVFQIGANAGQTATLAIGRFASDSIGVGASTVFTALVNIRVDSSNNAQESISVVDQAIKDVSTLRGKLGAFQQQTLESTANNLRATLDNTVAAESVIRDTDFAKETAEFSKQQVLMQVGTTVLANANSTSQLVLALLRQ
jgi:flagellin